MGAAQRTEQPQATPRDMRPREWKEARWAEEAPRAPTRPWWAWLPRSAPPGGSGCAVRLSRGLHSPDTVVSLAHEPHIA